MSEPLDFTGLMRDVGDRETALGLVARYIDVLRGQLKRLEAVHPGSDMDALRREAHSIKGSALNMHAPALERAAETLERASGERAADCLQTLVMEFDKVCAYHEKLVKPYETM